MADLTVDVFPYVIWRSKVRWPGEYKVGNSPEYDPFISDPRIELLEIMKSSSIVGPSHATLRLASGISFEGSATNQWTRNDDLSQEISPELADDAVLNRGDRVVIGQQISNRRINWLWGGYVTTSAILIDNNAERLTWKLFGPEWLWGLGGQYVGGDKAIYGQIRRNATADDDWKKNGGVTPFKGLRRFSDLVATFNPEGRANMTINDVELTESGTPIQGRVWEESDRSKDDKPAAKPWDALNAAKMLCTTFNRSSVTRIDPPQDWESVAMRATDILRDVQIDGLCLYDALKQVFGSRFGFYIDPVPQQVNGSTWGPFSLKFFSRSRTDGQSGNAIFFMNQRGTTMEKATASVRRIEYARDVAKLVNRVVIGAKYIRHVRLIYWGGAVAKIESAKKKLAIQQAWEDAEGKLNDFAGKDDLESPLVAEAVNELTVDKDTVHNGEWHKRYVTTGAEHLKYAHVFRRFWWNEANELNGDKAITYGGTAWKWYVPDLAEIADINEVDATTRDKYARRRRPMLDSIYLLPGSVDQWQRLRPTLYIAIAPKADDKNFAALKWRKVTEASWELDRQRAGFIITAEDVAAWRPFENQDKESSSGSTPTPNDPRTFATLLRQGVLRLCLEGSIEVDYAMEKAAMPTNNNGSPYLREVFVRSGSSYVKTLIVNDGFLSPSGLTPAAIDQDKDALVYAELLRDAGQEQKVNASMLVEGDYEEQAIGLHVGMIEGTRQISLASNASGRGAQIVAVKLDIQNNVWEYLTESAALALAERDRKTLAGGTKVFHDRGPVDWTKKIARY